MAVYDLDKLFTPDFSRPGVKPVGPVEVDWSNPISRGLIAYYPFNQTGPSVSNLVSRFPSVLPNTTAGTARIGAAPHGMAGISDGGSGQQWKEPSDALPKPPHATYAILASRRVDTTTRYMIDHGFTGRFMMRIIGTDLNCYFNGGFVTQPHGIDVGELGLFVATADGSTGRMYSNGVEFGSTSISDLSTGDRKFTINGYSNSTGFCLDQDVYGVWYWDRALSPEEVRSLANSPYQLLKPVSDIVYFPAAAAGGATVSPDSGTYTYTGQVPVVTGVAGVEVSPANGALSHAGQAPVVTASDHHTASPANGSLTHTGFAPGVVAGNNIEVLPGSGSLTHTGQAPVIETPVIISPSNGSHTYTGQVPTVAQGDNVEVSPANGSLTHTGQTPVIETPVTVSPSNGSLTHTGQAPVVIAGNGETVLPASGTLSLVGQSPAVETSDHITITPAAGVLTLVGQAPTVSVDGPTEVSPANGTVTYLGFAPGVSVGGILTPSFRTVIIGSESRLITISAESRIQAA